MAGRTKPAAGPGQDSVAAARASLKSLQQQALSALQAGHRAYLNAVCRNDPDAEKLLTRNRCLDQAAARLEAMILENAAADLRLLGARFQEQREALATTLEALQATVRHGESVADAVAWLDKITTLLLRVLA